MNAIILLGIKHCGKSTQGRLLANHFRCSFFDTDDEITALTGKSPREIYAVQGKDAFLQAETAACKKLAELVLKSTALDSEKSKIVSVIATGGGICNNSPALDELRKLGYFVFLNVDEKTSADRIIREIKYEGVGVMKNLPAYISKENPKNVSEVREIFHNFYIERQKKYKDLCDIEINLKPTSSKNENMEKIAKKISEVL